MGLKLLVMSGAQEAIHAIEEMKDKPDLMIIESSLQGMDGLQLGRLLHSRDYTRRILKILLSDSAGGDVDAGPEEMGFHGFLSKPVHADELQRCINEVLVREDDPGRGSMITRTTIRESNPLHGEILVVEDNITNCEVVCGMLSKLGEFNVAIAHDGEEAVKMGKEKKFDLILMDMQMPKMDGLQATQHLREDCPFNGFTPIVALTANAMSEHRESCLKAGMNDYLSKPILPADLTRVL